MIKRPTANAAGLSPAEFEHWTPILLDKLQRYAPRVACFHGLTGYRPFLKFGLKSSRIAALGPQPELIGSTRLFVLPNPSPANAHFKLGDQIDWYNRLAEFL